jgi:integrase
MVNRLQKSSIYIFHEENQDPITSLLYARRNFERQRKRLAAKLQNPRLLQIHFHSLGHYFATMTYHRTRDIVYTQQVLGHRSIIHTLRYIQFVNFESNQFVSRVAKTIKEAEQLVEAGFDYVTTSQENLISKKRE